ncbi:hypothetical protein [Acinetobacter sp. BSP-28]|uniref:hypothetical protein n=1 Tax=Acinetobacter sp. BSP-28 TaxID=3344661 RepID=UPI00376FEC34
MEIYKDINNDSNVTHYEIDDNHIRVKFRGTAKIYQYSYRKAGKFHVDRMKILARSGDGLNSYINLNVKFKYD